MISKESNQTVSFASEPRLRGVAPSPMATQRQGSPMFRDEVLIPTKGSPIRASNDLLTLQKPSFPLSKNPPAQLFPTLPAQLTKQQQATGEDSVNLYRGFLSNSPPDKVFTDLQLILQQLEEIDYTLQEGELIMIGRTFNQLEGAVAEFKIAVYDAPKKPFLSYTELNTTSGDRMSYQSFFSKVMEKATRWGLVSSTKASTRVTFARPMSTMNLFELQEDASFVDDIVDAICDDYVECSRSAATTLARQAKIDTWESVQQAVSPLISQLAQQEGYVLKLKNVLMQSNDAHMIYCLVQAFNALIKLEQGIHIARTINMMAAFEKVKNTWDEDQSLYNGMVCIRRSQTIVNSVNQCIALLA